MWHVEQFFNSKASHFLIVIVAKCEVIVIHNVVQFNKLAIKSARYKNNHSTIGFTFLNNISFTFPVSPTALGFAVFTIASAFTHVPSLAKASHAYLQLGFQMIQSYIPLSLRALIWSFTSSAPYFLYFFRYEAVKP